MLTNTQNKLHDGADTMTSGMFHTLQTNYLTMHYRLCLLLVPGKVEALHQNLCSSTYPSLLSRKEYQSKPMQS